MLYIGFYLLSLKYKNVSGLQLTWLSQHAPTFSKGSDVSDGGSKIGVISTVGMGGLGKS